MDLNKELEELNKQIEAEDAALLSGEPAPEPEPEPESTPEPTAEPEEPNAEEVEEKTDEKAAPAVTENPEEVKADAVKIPDVKTALDETPPEGGWQRLRWEAANERRLRQEAERKLSEKEAAPAVKKEENYEAFIEGEIGMTKKEILTLKSKVEEIDREEELKNTIKLAKKNVFKYEETFLAQNPDIQVDYKDALQHYYKAVALGVRVNNPDLDGDELSDAIQFRLLQNADAYVSKGLNPSAAMYQDSYRKFGYKPSAAARPAVEAKKEETTTERRPNLAKVAENKKRSANMAGSGGSGTPSMTNETMDQMTNAEMAKLTPSDWERLERESASA